MPGWLTATLRWIIAIGVAVGLFLLLGPVVVEEVRDAVGVDRGEEELPETKPAVGPPPLKAGRVEAIANVGVSVGVAEQLSTRTVTVGPRGVDTLLLGFEPVPTDPACLSGVALEVFLHEGVETPVHAFPARIDDLRELTDGEPLPANYLLDRTDPGAAYTTGVGGWLRFKVRGPYQLAARAAADDAPVVLAIRLPKSAESDAGVVLSTIEDRPARLRWAAVEGCEVQPDRNEADPLPGEDTGGDGETPGGSEGG